MHWREEGTGDPIVFLHAFPFHSEMWEAQLRALPNGWRGIAPDFRGFGRTPGAGTDPYTMEMYADDVIALLEHLKLDQAVFCGLSMGGYVLMALYRKYADRVRSMILCDTRATADSAEAKQNRLQLAARVRAEGVQVVVDSMLPKLLSEMTRKKTPDLVRTVREMMLSNSPDTVARALEGIAARSSSEDILKDTLISVTVIHGEDDAIIPKVDAEILARSTRGARLTLIPDAGHLPNLEQPELFNRAVNDFLEHLPPNYCTVNFTLG